MKRLCSRGAVLALALALGVSLGFLDVVVLEARASEAMDPMGCADGVLLLRVDGLAVLAQPEGAKPETLGRGQHRACVGAQLTVLQGLVVVDFGARTTVGLVPTSGMTTLMPPPGSPAYLLIASNRVAMAHGFRRGGLSRGAGDEIWWPMHRDTCSESGGWFVWGGGPDSTIADVKLLDGSGGSERSFGHAQFRMGRGFVDRDSFRVWLGRARAAGMNTLVLIVDPVGPAEEKKSAFWLASLDEERSLSAELDSIPDSFGPYAPLLRANAFIAHGQWGPAACEFSRADHVLATDPEVLNRRIEVFLSLGLAKEAEGLGADLALEPAKP